MKLLSNKTNALTALSAGFRTMAEPFGGPSFIGRALFAVVVGVLVTAFQACSTLQPPRQTVSGDSSPGLSCRHSRCLTTSQLWRGKGTAADLA